MAISERSGAVFKTLRSPAVMATCEKSIVEHISTTDARMPGPVIRSMLRCWRQRHSASFAIDGIKARRVTEGSGARDDTYILCAIIILSSLKIMILFHIAYYERKRRAPEA